RLILERLGGKYKPPIFAVEPPESRFCFPANASLQHTPPHISQLVHVLGMNGHCPAPSNGLCLRKPGVLQPSAIQIFCRTIDARQPHQSWNGIERCLELAVSHRL